MRDIDRVPSMGEAPKRPPDHRVPRRPPKPEPDESVPSATLSPAEDAEPEHAGAIDLRV